MEVNRKITLVQESTSSGCWHWIILEWDGQDWHNIGSGLETSYELAAKKAKEVYDGL